MDRNLAKFLKGLGDTIFMSDIRTKIDDSGVTDLDIIWNRSMVHNWISIMKPRMSMVKFRTPYYNRPIDFDKHKGVYENEFKLSKKYGIDFCKNYKSRIFRMSKAELFIQPWAGATSSEMRGHIAQKDILNIISYNIKQIEDKLYYYNRIARITYHTNDNVNKKLHFCNCNDCAVENNIWKEYMNNNKTMPQNITHYIHNANKTTNRKLSKVHDINVYDTLDADKLERMMSITNKSTKYKPSVSQRGNLAPPGN